MKPLLAAKLEKLSDLRYPVMATPKLDGIRCLVWQGRALTRKLKPIPNRHIRETLEAQANLDLDGELMIPGADFNGVQSAVMSEEGKPDFQYVVFDVIHTDLPYSERIDLYPKCLQPMAVWNEAELLAYERYCLAKGYEGVMLRSPQGQYKFGRSTVKEGILLKWKRFLDAEAVIVGFEERIRNANEAGRDELGYTKRSASKAGMIPSGTLGALMVKTGDISFAIGTGFDDAARAFLWAARDKLVGKVVNYTYQELSSYGVPRFPVFKGFRPEVE